MKKKKILALTTVIALSTTTFAFANEIKIIKKNGQDYVPFKKLVKKLGGEVTENRQELKGNMNSKEVIIQNELSFAKVDEKYYSLESKEINGYKVPIDKNPLSENEEVYVSLEFLKNAKLLDFDIQDGKLIIYNKFEKETTSTVKKQPKKEATQNNSKTANEEVNTEIQQKPQTIVKPTRPSSNQNNNSNNSNNNDSNNSSNNSNNNDSNNSSDNSNNNDSNNSSDNSNNNNSDNSSDNNSNKPNNDNDQNNSSNNNDSNNNSNNGSSEDNSNSEDDNSNNSQENDDQVSLLE